MASINKVFLLGNLGQDPDVRYTESGTAVATLNLATNRSYKNRDGQPVTETEWHRVVLFGRTAELAKDYLRKGRSVFIEGRLRTRKWTDQNGIDRYTTEIVCDIQRRLRIRTASRSASCASTRTSTCASGATAFASSNDRFYRSA